jgi:hypothetical protein
MFQRRVYIANLVKASSHLSGVSSDFFPPKCLIALIGNVISVPTTHDAIFFRTTSGDGLSTWRVARLPSKRWCVVSIPALGGFYPERIIFVLGTAGFRLSYPSSLFAFGTIRPPLLQFPLSKTPLSIFFFGKLGHPVYTRHTDIHHDHPVYFI